MEIQVSEATHPLGLIGHAKMVELNLYTIHYAYPCQSVSNPKR